MTQAATQGDMIQVHLLTAYPAALLNRDDAGLAKRVPFGGKTRVRISSQCLKKHWRESGGVTELGDLAHRSTRVFEQLVAQPLMEQPHGAAPEEATAIAQYLMSQTVDTKAVKGKDGEETARSSQLLVLTRAETDFLAELGVDVLRRLREKGVTATKPEDVKKAAPIEDKEMRKTLQGLRASVDTALFGRMITSDLFARVDSAVSVAHAFTTHEEEAETDYFTAVDTLNRDDAGAGLIQETELTSGVFYTYAVIDMNQLRSNLSDRAEIAERLGRNLVHAMATTSPGAKRGSTAPYAYAEFVLLERGPEQPRTLANAFLEPVRANGTNVLAASAERLMQHRARLAEMYDEPGGEVRLATLHDVPADGVERTPLRSALAAIFREG
jgi:CRISPR system Cascade subunit CasC